MLTSREELLHKAAKYGTADIDRVLKVVCRKTEVRVLDDLSDEDLLQAVNALTKVSPPRRRKVAKSRDLPAAGHEPSELSGQANTTMTGIQAGAQDEASAPNVVTAGTQEEIGANAPSALELETATTETTAADATATDVPEANTLPETAPAPAVHPPAPVVPFGKVNIASHTHPPLSRTTHTRVRQ